MKKNSLILLVSLICITINAQKIYFPKTYYADSLSIERGMPLLATQLITVYNKDKNRESYLNNLYRLQLVARQYKEMLGTINNIGQEIYGDSIKNRVVGFAYKAYAKTIGKQPKSKNQFKAYYNAVFDSLYETLNTENQNILPDYFENSLTDIVSRFQLKIKSVQSSDSIEVKDAVVLCRNYCSYKTYTTTLKLSKEKFAQKDKEKYIIDENILITLPNGSEISGAMVRNRNSNVAEPVVMLYNIYAGYELAECKEIANKGYVGFVANTRGKRLSKDSIEPYEHDGDDAYYIIDWISKQSWCNGKVGMYGGSYLGFSQWSSVKKVHPALKTIVPQVSVGVGIDFPMQNGVFMSYALQWIRYVSNTKLSDNVDFRNSQKWEAIYTNYFKDGKSFRSLDAIEGKPSLLFQRWLDHPSYDKYWQDMTPQKEAFANITIPILSTTGYYDDDQLGAMYYYKQYQKWNKSDNYYLIIGPFDHGGAQRYPKKELGGYQLDKSALIPINTIIFEWFDYILKSGKRPDILKDKVNFAVMGKNQWKHVASLDKMHNEELIFYMGNDDKKWSLVSKPFAKLAFRNQTIDFKDRSELNIWGDNSICGFNRIQDTILKTEKHLMVFESDQINETYAISGSLKASIKLSCNKKDIDINLLLYEKTPEGHYFALTNNLQRASYSKDRTKRQLLRPNTIETIELNETFVTCKQLEKGSRIVVVVGVNKNPNWQVNYGSGKDVSEETIEDAAIPLEVNWFNSSSISIPILR
jgi:uncharacterized protein